MKNQNIKTTFIYAPTSGERVFASRMSEEMVKVSYTNKSAHILHDSVVLSWHTANPGRDYCRSEVTLLLKNLVAARGGVAWDENGTIHAIPPRKYAVEFLEYVEVLR